MIVFDLRCAGGHLFEEWFASTAEYEEKLARHAIACPECGGREVTQALSSPRINSGAAAAPMTPCGLPACAGGACQLSGRD